MDGIIAIASEVRADWLEQHAFANRATDSLRIMIMWIPGGAEGLFQEMREYLQTVDGARNARLEVLIRVDWAIASISRDSYDKARIKLRSLPVMAADLTGCSIW